MINAGLRIRGGWSRHPDYPKHAFRLFFRNEYGAAKLNFPLFGGEGVDEFDKIDIRCEQNYSYANWGEHNTMVREVFSRDSQRDMGEPYTRSRYYHLYINGMYWGVYETQERSEANYAASYLNGKQEDFDVLKVSTQDWSYQVEATDGDMTYWNKVYNLCNSGFADNANYYKLEGKDAGGNPLPGSEVLVDIDNLIDYMLTIFYTGNFDAPTSAFGGNAGPNNFYAIKNRNDKTRGFIFLNHDGEHAMMVDPVSPGIGINENRVTLPDMTVSGLTGFHPQWLHYRLSANPEYRMRFADRAAMHMTGSGALTPSMALIRFNTRVNQIDMAIIAESARWGDTRTYPALTKDNQWLNELSEVTDQFIPYRTNIVLNQLKDADLFPSINPPKIKNGTTEITSQNYHLTTTVAFTLLNPNASGQIYYTTNGSDPRNAGGTVSSNAISGTGSVVLNLNASAIIKSRIYNNGAWSALRELTVFSTIDNYQALKITELNYHPMDKINGTDTIDGKSFEFIEFKNTGETALNLSGFRLDSAVSYTFPPNTILAPGNFYVIASKPQDFYATYGLIPSGNCDGFFGNAGDTLIVYNASDEPVITFMYSDDSPWPQTPDGKGNTLSSFERNPTGDPSDYNYWTSSTTAGGSPFSDDLQYVNTNEIAVNGHGRAFSIYPNPCSQYLLIEPFTDSNSNKTVKYSLSDIRGAVVFQGIFENSTVIDLQSLGISRGLYVLHLECDSFTQIEKIVFK
jgi:hypothetical protein